MDDTPMSAANEPSGARILLVDDHDDTRMIVARMLKMRGYEVIGASTKKEALDLFREQMIDLVISDLGLPDGSGHELMETITAEKPTKGIALSGYGSEEDAARSRAVGFQKHLTKPIDFALLEEAIREVLA